MPIADDLPLRRARDVSVSAIVDGAVLVNLRTNRCWQLNGLGHDIWVMLEQEKTVAAICETLARRFSVPREQLSTDVRELVESLVRENLVEPVSPPGVPPR